MVVLLFAAVSMADGPSGTSGGGSYAGVSRDVSHAGVTAVAHTTVQAAGPSAAQRPSGSGTQFLYNELAQRTALYFACLGIYVLLGAFFLVYWRWLPGDLPLLSVGVLALLMAVHTAAISGSLAYVLPSLLDVQAGVTIEIVSYLLLNGVVALTLWAFFPHAFHLEADHWSGAVNVVVAGGAVVASVVLTLMVLASGTDQTAILPLSRWITVILMIVVVVLAIRGIQSRSAYGNIDAVALALLVVGSIHDVLFAGVGGTGRPYLITFAVLGFILLQTYVVVRRSAESMYMAQLSSRRLRREVDVRTKELRAATVAAHAANMAKTQFVADVTHELRTPLASMLGYVELIREEVGEHLAPAQREFLDNLELSGESLLALVNNLLDLAKIESGHIALTTKEVDVARVVEDVRSQLYPLAREKDLHLKTEIEAERTCIETDERWLSMILANLVSNAVKYTDEGGVTLRVKPDALEDVPSLAVEVIDTGSGISEAFMPRLFERFSREERSGGAARDGTGLGLTITRELVQLLGGEIRVASRPGNGSTFTVVLPADDTREVS